MEVKEENDPLILFGQWMCIKSKIGTVMMCIS